MGTRSLTVVVDSGWDKSKEICVLYRQFDGYPSAHGAELKSFLDGFEICNGIGARKPKLANGAGCLAAQLIKHFKDDVGGFYLHAAGERDCGEEYVYIVTVGKPGEEIQLEVIGYDKTIFKGAVSAFNPKMEEEAA